MKLIHAFLFCALLPLSVFAEDAPIQQLKHFIQSSASFSADFRQVGLGKAGRAGQNSSGKFYLSRPGRFRWNYQSPFSQEIVSNGGKVWFYDPDLEQVTVKKLDDSLGSTPALLLTGQVDIENRFNLEEQGSDGDMHWIKLSPKDEDSGFKYVLIGLEKAQLAGMELSDNFGQLTRIYFSNIRINPPLDDSLFNFTVPKGVDVFDNN